LDLTKTPLWEHLSDDVREDLIAAASAALPEMVLSAEEAIPSENRITTRALATLNAASLSYGAGTFSTAALSDDAIIGLVTASLAYPFSLSETADAAFQLAIQAASDRAPMPLHRAIEAVLAHSD